MTSMMSMRAWPVLSGRLFSSSSTTTTTTTICSSFRELFRDAGQGRVTLSHADDDSSSPTAVLTLDNPGRKNALSGRMMVGLGDAVASLSSSPPSPFSACSSVILHGAHSTFCAGADLKFVSEYGLAESAEAGVMMSTFMHGVTQGLRAAPVMSVAAIEGFAVGGGAELSTACDFRVMASDATLQFVHVRMGTSPGWGGGGRLTKIVGRRTALVALGSGRPWTADECLDIGLVDAVAPPGEALRAAKEWCGQFVHGDGGGDGNDQRVQTVRAMKEVVHNGDELELDEALEKEIGVFQRNWASPANRAAVEGSRHSLS